MDAHLKNQQIPKLLGYLLPLGFILVILQTGLMPALLAGLLVRETVLLLEPTFATLGDRARSVALGTIGLIFVGVLIGIGSLSYGAVMGEGGLSILSEIANALSEAKVTLPQWLTTHIPATTLELKQALITALTVHADQARLFSGQALHTIVLLLLGIVIGALSLFQKEWNPSKPLLKALDGRADNLTNAFSKVVFAQVKIAALNTVLTGVLLFGILPAFDVRLPFGKTMLLVTFIFGLIPIVGNIASNVLLCVVGLTHSLYVALAMLAYLVLIHTLEHFLNAVIIGQAVRSKAVELLPAMLLGETLFGIAGLISAPILYTWFKTEAKQANWI